MVIERYSDLKNIKSNIIVDLSKLDCKKYIRVLDFLSGLTYKNGKLIKVERQKYLVIFGGYCQAELPSN